MRESVAGWVVWGRLYAFRESGAWSCGQMGALKIENGMITFVFQNRLSQAAVGEDH